MTGPRPQQFDRAWAKRNGYTDAEIDAYLAQNEPPDPYKPTTPRVASESTTAVRDKAPERNDGAYLKGLARQGAQGATFGWADELEAAARAPFSDRTYRDIRNDVRGQNDEFTRENPLTSLAANLAGGIATGGAGGAALKAAGMAPKAAATMTAAGRAGRAALGGAAAGAIGGAGVANEMRDVPGSVIIGGVTGGALGAGLSAGIDSFRGARNILAGMGRGNKPTQGPVARFVQAETPEEAGARRVLASMGRAGQSVDDLAAANAGADDVAALAELVPDKQGVRSLRVARNVGRERDVLDRSLAERAADEPARWSESVTRNTGVTRPRDPKEVARAARSAALSETAPLYEAANNLPPVVDDDVGNVAGTLKNMKEFGPRAIKRAETLAASRNDGFPKSFRTDAIPDTPSRILGPDGLPAGIKQGTPAQTTPTSVRNVLDLRRGLDEVIGEMEDAGESPAILSELVQMRQRIDAIAKGAGDVVKEADDKFSTLMARGESFASGNKVEQAGTEDAINAMVREARDKAAFREGSASKLLERAAGVADGEGGQIRNPVQGSVGSPLRRARTRTAFADDASFEATRADAAKIVDRTQTRHAVSGNSTTAANLSEMADEFANDPTDLLRAAVNPMGALRSVGAKVVGAAQHGVNAQQATQMGKLLGAGLPGQMTRDEALAILKRMEPAVIAQLQGQLARRAGMAGALTGFAGRSVGSGR